MIQPGDYYSDCAYRPLQCIKIDLKEDELRGRCLLDDQIYLCSPKHCGPELLTKGEAKHLKYLWEEKGELAVLVHQGWNEEYAKAILDEIKKIQEKYGT